MAPTNGVAVTVTVPVGVSAGQPFDISYQGRMFRVSCPQGVREGQRITVKLQTTSRMPIVSPEKAALERLSMKNWPFDLLSCCSYRYPDTKEVIWWPVCFPNACCASYCVLGCNHTKQIRETPCCCSDRPACDNTCCGSRGCVVCWLAGLGSCFLPIPIHPTMCCCTCIQRKELIEKYGIGNIPPGTNVDCFSGEVCEGYCVACALTQQNELLRLYRLKADGRPLISNNAITAPSANQQNFQMTR
mmetsp:Transcript_19470/g.32739  ORF Transcript_19470/g.32739 Transcript_19470/m.32739 type:complete len:245 (+) Transcript_19470:273-1007(+)